MRLKILSHYLVKSGPFLLYLVAISDKPTGTSTHAKNEKLKANCDILFCLQAPVKNKMVVMSWLLSH